MTLRLVPPNDGEQEPADEPSCPPSASEAITDGEALENRVTLQRLADRLEFLGRPGEWMNERPKPNQVVVVFDDDAMPELVSLLYRRSIR
jgi:hypothetical protein